MAQKKAVIIRTDGTIEHVLIDGLADMQKAVGGLIEMAGRIGGSDMYANEEGIIMGLAPNLKATALRNQTGLWSPYPIHGDVLLIGGDDETGDTVDVSEKAVMMAERL